MSDEKNSFLIDLVIKVLVKLNIKSYRDVLKNVEKT